MKNMNMPMTREGNAMTEMDETSLMAELQNSIMTMHQKMQETYSTMMETNVIGTSSDKLVEVTFSATHEPKKIDIKPRAYADANGKFSQKELEWRLLEALKDAHQKAQNITQTKTAELLKGMDIPQDIKNLSLKNETDK